MKAMTAVETAANAVIPFHPMGAAKLDDGIDGIVFEYTQTMLAYLLKLFSLDDIARNPNQLSITLFHMSQLASKSTTHGPYLAMPPCMANVVASIWMITSLVIPMIYQISIMYPQSSYERRMFSEECLNHDLFLLHLSLLGSNLCCSYLI
jgi:hypothetical protein